jgi:hypothetical protein
MQALEAQKAELYICRCISVAARLARTTVAAARALVLLLLLFGVQCFGRP